MKHPFIVAGLVTVASVASAAAQDDKLVFIPGLKIEAKPLLVMLPEGKISVMCFKDVRFQELTDVITFLGKGGWWPQSIAISGDLNEPRYALVVAKQDGVTPPEREVSAWKIGGKPWQPKAGFGPVSVSASRDLFVVISEKGAKNTLGIHVGEDKLDEDLEKQYRLLRTLRGIAVGRDMGSGKYHYATLFEQNPGKNVAWTCDQNLTTAMAQERFGIWRNQARSHMADIAYYSGSGAGAGMVQVWNDDDAGKWASFGDMSAAQLDQKISEQKTAGLFPVSLRAVSVGAATRYAAIFGNRLKPRDRVFQSVSSVPQAKIPVIETLIENMMRSNGARHAQLAVCLGTKLVYSRAYSLVGEGDIACDENTTFRQASVAKPFVALALYRLIDGAPLVPGTQKALTLDTKVQDILKIKPIKDKELAAGFSDITIRQLIAHRSGLGGDYLWSDGDVAAAFDGKFPVSMEQIASYAASQTMKNAPSDSGPIDYNNTGTMLLGLVLKTMTNAPSVYAAQKSLIYDPLKLKTARPSRTAWSKQPANEAFYLSRFNYPDDWGNWNTKRRNNRLGLAFDYSQSQPQLGTLGYGRDNMENSAAPGGLSANAIDVVRLAAALASPDADGILSAKGDATKRKSDREKFLTDCLSGGRYAFDTVQKAPDGNYIGWKGGSLAASGNVLYFNSGGVSFSISAGVSASEPPSFYPKNDALIQAITSRNWDGTDLWPKYGYPQIDAPVLKPNPKLSVYEANLKTPVQIEIEPPTLRAKPGPNGRIETPKGRPIVIRRR